MQFDTSQMADNPEKDGVPIEQQNNIEHYGDGNVMEKNLSSLFIADEKIQNESAPSSASEMEHVEEKKSEFNKEPIGSALSHDSMQPQKNSQNNRTIAKKEKPTGGEPASSSLLQNSKAKKSTAKQVKKNKSKPKGKATQQGKNVHSAAHENHLASDLAFTKNQQ
ncbi:hypothetical protein RFI_09699 [Reticulomyxa filosa]|uniref:Uncharacterized protein n=1 Tax=Reticulomyxa filosa TaxID=46433 RepID=X6NQ06_RETFI|nr:hypothetical protein RFI_09699 [Reticulomyxa filosa]|eukprot:ETO27432.1 hypothetical protein RFI_09699 [Reticulomyxa filosa]